MKQSSILEKQHVCKFCGKEFKTGLKLGGHVNLCENNPNRNNTLNKIKSSKRSHFRITKLLTCVVCGQTYFLEITKRNFKSGNYRKTCCSKCAHKLQSSRVDKKKKNSKTRTTLIMNYLNNFNVTKHIKKYTCEYCGHVYNFHDSYFRKYFNYTGEETRKYCCKECMIKNRHKKLSENAKRKNLGGYNEYSATGYHRGVYNGIRFDSSWELAFLIYYIEHGLYIERCKEVRTYNYNGKSRRYYPDFKTDEGIIEIKGYVTEQTKCKIRDNKDIKVLYYNDIKTYIDYSISKYGRSFWSKFME